MLTKYKHGAATPEQKKVRPMFSILVGIVIVGLTAAIQNNGN
jgi:hypothetical protein